MITAYDTETWLIRPGLLAPPLVCASEATEVPGSDRLLSKGEARVRFRELLRNGGIVGAHVVYDLGVMAADARCLGESIVDEIFEAVEQGKVWDVLLLEALHDNARGCLYKSPTGEPFGRYSLKLLEQRYLGIDRTKDKAGDGSGADPWRLRYAELDGIPVSQWPQEAIDYPKADARGTLEVYRRQAGDVLLVGAEGEGQRFNSAHAPFEQRAAWALHLASMWGMRTDPVLVQHVVAEIKQTHEESRKRFLEEGLVVTRKATAKERRESKVDLYVPDPRGADRPPVAMRYATKKAAIKARVEAAYAGHPPLTSGGKSGKQQTSTDRDTLVNSGDELLEAFGEAGPNEKNLTYVRIIEQGTTVPINTEYTIIMSSDRVSSAKPNLQNLPRKGKIRNCFVPRAGFVFSDVDYGTLELCTLAQICFKLFGYSKLRDVINDGKDIHSQLAATIMGISYDEAMALKKSGDKKFTNMRQLAKPIDFGLPGLMGPPKLVLTARKDGVRFCELSGASARCADNPRLTEWGKKNPYQIAPSCVVCLELAVKYKNLFFETWPEVAEYHDLVTQVVETGEPLESLSLGGMLRREDNSSAACNHFFQNLAAVGMKDACWRIQKETFTDRKSPLFGAFRMVIAIHDETVGEAWEPRAHEIGMRHAEIMRSTMQEHVPDVKITAEPTLTRRLFKGSERRVDKDGRLVPWWPTNKDKSLAWDWAPDNEVAQADLARWV